MSTQQHGMSLPVVLALLLGMALVGTAVLQSGILQTRMAVAGHTRNLAFEAAEGALRAGEQIASGAPLPATSGCSGGLCGTPDPDAVERWRQPGFGGWQHLAGMPADGVPDAQWMVEYLGEAPVIPGCERSQPLPPHCLQPLYRITARSLGERGRAVLQSHYLDARISWRELDVEEMD